MCVCQYRQTLLGFWHEEVSVCLLTKPVSYFSPEPGDVRLVEGGSRCAGKMEMNHQGEWRNLSGSAHWTLGTAAVLCRPLGCGSVVSTRLIMVKTVLYGCLDLTVKGLSLH